MRKKIAGLAYAAMAVLFAGLGPGARPAEAGFHHRTPTRGGDGGRIFRAECGRGKMLVGIAGRAGKHVDSIRGLCQKINRHGRWTGPTTQTASHGGGGGNPFHLQCPTGNGVGGIIVRSGSLVDAIGVQCWKVGKIDRKWGFIRLEEGGPALGPVGGRGGTLHSDTCTRPGTYPRSIYGRAGTLVNQVSFLCGALKVLPEVKSVAFHPGTVKPGWTSKGTVILWSPAPAGGIHVRIENPDSWSRERVTVPRDVLVTAGKTTATFTAKAKTNATPGKARIGVRRVGSGYDPKWGRLRVSSAPP